MLTASLPDEDTLSVDYESLARLEGVMVRRERGNSWEEVGGSFRAYSGWEEVAGK